MNKQEFIEKLREKLSKLPQNEVEDRIAFYSEMIDDKIEDGFSEHDAVQEIGDLDKIASQIIADTPLLKIVKEKVKPKRKLRTWEIILIVLGSPIWLSLLISLVAVIFSVCVSLLAVIISLWAVFIVLCVCAVYGIVVGGIMMIIGDTLINFVIFSISIVCVGLSIFLYFGCIYATKGIIILTKKMVLIIKNSFVKKEEK